MGGLMRVLLCCAALAGAAMAGPANASGGRALWVWEADTRELVREPAAVQALLDLAQEQGIDTVYLYADAWRGENLIVEQPAAWRQLIRHLHGEGLQAYALLGSAYLKTEAYVLPERRADALAMFRRVLDYNRSAAAAERFDGINLDIEPHLLPQWSQDRTTLLRGFLELGKALMAVKREYGSAAAVGPAMPFWFDGIVLDWDGQVASVAEHTLRTYDYVALMDYRNRAAGSDGIIRHARDEMDMAARLGRRVVIGLEIGPSEPAKVTFQHLGLADLQREMELARQAFASDPAFGGFALHHYGEWRRWLQRQRRSTPQ